MFGFILYELRKERKVTQEEFSFLVGVSRQTIYKWENNLAIPSGEHFVKIMKVFNVDCCIINDKIRFISKWFTLELNFSYKEI